MKHYVGIDLGTTNSAVCSFDGVNIKLYKSPEQSDVTPSAIFIDRRGNKYVGARAYNNAPRNPDNAAVLFKRLMGSGTPIRLEAAGVTLTPEECSAEVLKMLYGYLPEDIRDADGTGTVITVPAAFNQMQKDATLSAAEAAGIGKVALMQEPVAAVMSVVRQNQAEGAFLVYDLGGGTLDIAIAESTLGRVSLLSHGGIAMCGGRDFDRLLLEQIVKPWLLERFGLPAEFAAEPRFKALARLATWAAERAKIELSAKEESTIALSEAELGVRDLAGNEVYLDIPLERGQMDRLIAPQVEESIRAARETLGKVGLGPRDIDRIVFIGGPTHYKPLRDKVAAGLGIAASTEVNPMTAVAEGAAVFAESIDWGSQQRGRKALRGAVSASDKLDLSFTYIARTPDAKAKISIRLGGAHLPGAEFQIDSLDTGWQSGRLPLKDATTVEVALSKPGENHFKAWVYSATGGPLKLENSLISITRTAATIDAIPASSSIGLEVLDKLGGTPVLDYLVKEGDALPKKGRKTFKAVEALPAYSDGSLNFKLWEGEIKDPIADNRFVGILSINGSDFAEGVIDAGAELVCDFEVLDSGNIVLEVTVPSIGGVFHSGRNFYSRQAGQIDYSSASRQVAEEADLVRRRMASIAERVVDPKVLQAMRKLEQAASLGEEESDPELTKQAMDAVLDAKKLLAQVRQEHMKEIRQIDLDAGVAFFNEFVRQHASPVDEEAFENLVRTAQRAIDNNAADFDNLVEQIKVKNYLVLFRNDRFVLDRFKKLAASPHLFTDRFRHAELCLAGMKAAAASDIETLRHLTMELEALCIGLDPGEGAASLATNIARA